MPSDRLPLDAQRRALGERRLGEFIERNAHLQTMAICLNISILTAPLTDYSDECMAAIATDAQDLADSADAFAAWARQLARHWRAQREEHGLGST